MELLTLACAVCGAGENDPSRGAYVWMSIIVSLIPLALLGGIVGYVVWKTRAGEVEPEENRVAEKR